VVEIVRDDDPKVRLARQSSRFINAQEFLKPVPDNGHYPADGGFLQVNSASKGGGKLLKS